LSIYKDEWCEREVAILMLTDQTVVSTRKGSYCTVFGVDQHRFCARTRDEKELWLRAVSNIKVKLMFDAPDPTNEELAVFRAAVLERIVKLESMNGSAPGEAEGLPSPRNPDAWDPLLPQVPRPPVPQSPRGDVWYPEPIEDNEAAESPATLEAPQIAEEISQGSHMSAKKLDAVDTAEVLEPDDCRKLLSSVGPMVRIKSDMPCSPAIDSGIIANEHPGAIRTVHTTEKVLMSQTPPECNIPEEVCTVNCLDLDPEDKASRLPAALSAEDHFQNETVPRSIPLLMWSPGRRQQYQRAV
jgi:hypothetical protein